MDTDLIHGDDIPIEWLTPTDWSAFEDPIVGTLVPNFSLYILAKISPTVALMMTKCCFNWPIWAQDTNCGQKLPRTQWTRVTILPPSSKELTKLHTTPSHNYSYFFGFLLGLRAMLIFRRRSKYIKNAKFCAELNGAIPGFSNWRECATI